MDRLVKAATAEVELKFRPSERCTADFKIESLIHTMPVAVQLTTTRPSLYTFSPASSLPALPTNSPQSYPSQPAPATLLPSPPYSPPAQTPTLATPKKKSPIYLAVSAGKLDSVKALVDAGATDRPFHEAAAGNRTDIIFLMIGKLGPGNKYWADTVDEQGRTAVHAAAEKGCVEALHLCLAVGGGDADRADARGWTPLHCAGAGGHLNAAEVIIANSSFDPRRALTREGKGKRRTPLAVAMEMGNNHMYELLRPLGGVIRVVGQRDQNGWTALHVAAFKGRMDMVKELVEGGAELEAVDDAGYTPFKCAVEAGNVEVALWLIRCGARGGVKGFLMATGGDGGVGVGGGRASAWGFSAATVSAALC